jgi:hypothetical protein
LRIPAREAVIRRHKLTHYLLVLRVEDDKSQYLAQAGFTLENPDALERAIRRLLESSDAIQDRSNEYGDYFRVTGALVGINGRILNVVTVWIMLAKNDGKFHFVTLKPDRG